MVSVGSKRARCAGAAPESHIAAAAHKRLAQYIRAQCVPTHVCGCFW